MEQKQGDGAKFKRGSVDIPLLIDLGRMWAWSMVGGGRYEVEMSMLVAAKLYTLTSSTQWP